MKSKLIKSKLLLLIVGLIILLTFQAKVLMPYIYEIAASDLFLEDSGDEANRQSTSNTMTIAAFSQCNSYIANHELSDYTVTSSQASINAFSLGNFRYVVNADIGIQPSDSASFTRRYVCRIKYANDEDNTDISNPDNWSVEGLSGLENI
ncbi:MAG: hypothetical protein GQ475_04465 [Methylococcaceae bacterium]|nr:hypothetical protein [Methylococcaceae bacterium]